MISLVILSSGLLGYRLLDTPTCTPVDFKVKTVLGNDSAYYTDEILSFTTLTFQENIKWDFNDNSNVETGTYVTHRFAREGKFFVKVIVGDGCELIHPITIKKALPDSDHIAEHILSNDNTFAGTPETFNCTIAADSYDWTVSEHPEFGIRSGASTVYKFETPGEYTIELTLNKNRLKKYRKIIQVATKPLIPKAPTKTGPQEISVLIPKRTCIPKILITDATFKEYIEKVVAGTYTAENFKDYLGNSEDPIPVILNGDIKNKMTFSDACNQLNGKKKRQNVLWKRKIRIQNVHLTRDTDNCILKIEINYY
jgi:hypothetical protein